MRRGERLHPGGQGHSVLLTGDAGHGSASSGPRGCVDMRLRRLGATTHNEPAPANQPHTPARFCASPTTRSASSTSASLVSTAAKSRPATVI
ncbi:hypothetical protein StrepF001_21655 [Streptomyces sp. F001]|nr:hypothetical protein StrepF001_21655 [Streptomyces sp. F001]